MTQSGSSRVVLVTGAAHGIGRSIALAFAQLGDTVVVNERDEEATRETVAAVTTAGGRAIGIGADLASRDAIDAMFERIRAEAGDVSVVVNNAAWYEFINPSRQSVDSFERTFAVDVNAVFHTMQASLEGMKRLGGGVIISIASLNAYVTIPQNAAYSAAKAAVVGLTRALALELGPLGIRVVSISPGFTATPAVEAYIASLSEERRQVELGAYYERTPLRRLVRPEEIADTAVFLASSKASAITGTDVLVDAGMFSLNKAFSYNP